MMQRARKIRIYVRNKQRYNPVETKNQEFLHVDVENFVGTTIADLKEDVRKQTKSSVRIDDLFLNNLPLADDRSVAHYNLQHDTILETTSNPFWVSCLYIKVAEVKQEQEGQPGNDEVQKWTNKSIPKKYTLIGLLLNSKKEYIKQPPHFSTLDDFVTYLEQLNKKGATMHPDYTQRDMRAFEREYRQEFLGRYNDPLAAFLDHYALKLGYLEPEEIDRTIGRIGAQQVPANNGRNQPKIQQNNGRQRQGRVCEDCELSEAVLYCTDCPGGIALCEPCSHLLHAGAKRRRHNLQDIRQAPKNQRLYIPRAFLAPFALTVAMYRSLTEGQLSLTEEEIKKTAQPLTDTDLMDKQNGRYVGGFDCMENMLIAKGLVKKEAARVSTKRVKKGKILPSTTHLEETTLQAYRYALTESGHVLGEKLYTFYVTFNSFLQQHQFPRISTVFLNRVAGNRKICLIIDEHERDKNRLLAFAADRHIDAQVRFLPAGDYVWILSPPMYDTNEKYLGNDPANEMVLPFVVERKSWEDFENSLNSNRFMRQVNNMLGSGIKNCFYLMEGSLSALKSNPSQHHQQQLKTQVQKLIWEYGFYVSYTSSWMKSAQWLLWFSQFVIQGCNQGLFIDGCISYSDYSSRVARQAGAAAPCVAFRNAEKVVHKWTSHLFIDHIFRDKQGERSLSDTLRQDLHVSVRKKHLLVIQDLVQYNKKRQSALNKCCELVCSNMQNAQEIVSDKIGAAIHNMVHYDVTCFWQLYTQVTVGVYVLRTENNEDTAQIQQKFLAGPQGPIPNIKPTKSKKTSPTKQTQPKQNKKSSNTNNQQIQTTVQGRDVNQQIQAVQGQGREVNTFHRIPVSKKSNIHTFSSTDLSQASDDASHQLHVNDPIVSAAGDRSIEKVGKTGQRERKASGGIPLHMVRPFSGEGRCLGDENDLDPLNMQNRGSNDEGDYQRGLVGGANESADAEGQGSFHGYNLKERDFVNPEDEDTILKEVLTKSEQEGVAVKNEDEMYRLALELSMNDQKARSTAADGKESKDNNFSVKNEDEMYRLALEMSMRESARQRPTAETRVDEIPESEEDQMKLALEMSLNESFNAANPQTSPLASTVDRNLQATIERSKLEFTQERHDGVGVKRKLSVANEMDKSMTPIQGDLTEEEQIKLAVELSKQKSGLKSDFANWPDEDSKQKSGFKSDLAKRPDKHTVKMDSDMNSDSHKQSSSSIYGSDFVKKRADSSGIANRESDEDEPLKIAIKKSKDEYYSPRKKLKSNISNREPDVVFDDEDKQLRMAIERSMVEIHSPRKRLKSGNQDENIRCNKAGDSDVCSKTSRVDDTGDKTEVIIIDFQSQDTEDEVVNDSTTAMFVETDDCVKFENESANSKENGFSVVRQSYKVLAVTSQSDQIFSSQEPMKLCTNTRDRHQRFVHNKVTDKLKPHGNDSENDTEHSDNENEYSDQAIQQHDTSSGKFARTQQDDSLLDKDARRRDMTENKTRFVSSGSDRRLCDTENVTGSDNINSEHKSEQVLKGSIGENCNVGMYSGAVNATVGTEKQLGGGVETAYTLSSGSGLHDDAAGEIHGGADEDCVLPSPNKLSKSVLTLTPVLSQGLRSFSMYQTEDQRMFSISQSSKDIHTKTVNSTNNKCDGENLGPKMSNKECSKSERGKKKVDLRASLFYNSDEDSCDSDDNSDEDTDDLDDDSDGHCAIDVDQKHGRSLKETSAHSKSDNCIVIPGNIFIKSSNNSQNFEHSNSKKETAEHSTKAVEKHSDKEHGKSDADCMTDDTDKEQVKYDMETDIDDDIHDIDYMPESQDLEQADTDCSDTNSDTESLDTNTADVESLPLIQRPRIVRYRELKTDTNKLLQRKQSRNAVDEESKDANTIKTENVTDDIGFDSAVCEADVVYSDEEFARKVQDEINQIDNDSFRHQKAKDNLRSLVYQDEMIAKELHEKLNRGADNLLDIKTEPQFAQQYDNPKTVEELDETYAKQLDIVLNGDKNNTAAPNEFPDNPSGSSHEINKSMSDNQLDLVKGKSGGNLNMFVNGEEAADVQSQDFIRNTDMDKVRGFVNMEEVRGADEVNLGGFVNMEEEVAELQRQELEKIERWRRVIMDDESLARQLQQIEEMEIQQTDKPKSTLGPGTSTASQNAQTDEDVDFKQMIAMHRASREKALSQLNEYRQLQMERFRSAKTQTETGHRASTSTGYMSRVDDQRPPIHSQPRPVIQIDDDGESFNDYPDILKTQSNDWSRQVNRQHIDQSQPSSSSHVTNLGQSQPPSSSHVPFFSQSQVPSSIHVTNFDQSQLPSSSHVTDSIQSLSQVKNSNITCGNCGEKGHNRTFNMCKKYHTAEETARREAKLEKSRQQKEERKKMEVETLNLLANQQQALEEMTDQIQTEMDTIQRRLKSKTSELEKQVSNRMKKLEKAKKKQKR